MSAEAEFDAAIDRNDLDLAWALAGQIRPLRLDRALRLTMLALRWRRPGHARIARAFLARFIGECAPSPRAIKKTADALDVIANRPENWIAERAWEGMIDLAGQIQRSEVRPDRPFYEQPWGDW